MSEQANRGNLIVAGIELPATKMDAFTDPIIGSTLQEAETAFDHYERTEVDPENPPLTFLIAKHALLGISNVAILSGLLRDPEHTEQLISAIKDQRGNFWEVFDFSPIGSMRVIMDWAKRQQDAGERPNSVTIKNGRGFNAEAGVRTVYEKIRNDRYAPYESEEPELWFEMASPHDETYQTVRLNYRAKLLDPGDIYAKKLERWTLNWASADSGSLHSRYFATLVPFYESTGDWMRVVGSEELVDGKSGDIITRTQYRDLIPALYAVHSDRASHDRDVIKRMLHG